MSLPLSRAARGCECLIQRRSILAFVRMTEGEAAPCFINEWMLVYGRLMAVLTFICT